MSKVPIAYEGHMPLASPEEIIKWLGHLEEEYDWDGLCPLCQKKEWKGTSQAFDMLGATDRHVLTSVMPVTCSNCGYTFHLNAATVKHLMKELDMAVAKQPMMPGE